MPRKYIKERQAFRRAENETALQRHKRLEKEAEEKHKGKKKVMVKDPTRPRCYIEKWIDEVEPQK